MKDSMSPVTGLADRLSARVVFLVLAGLFLGACSEQSQEPAVQVASNPGPPATATEPPAMGKGIYAKPAMEGFTLHNEYDDDGDGDGINETHVVRYINSQGDTLFSMTTNGILWTWSLDTKGDDDADVTENYVIMDSDCNGFFDERYRLDAEFHLPACLALTGADGAQETK
ncbi:MAG: hypothetical protein WBQ78_06645 [Gammaproteobacteria bacterium]